MLFTMAAGVRAGAMRPPHVCQPGFRSMDFALDHEMPTCYRRSGNLRKNEEENAMTSRATRTRLLAFAGAIAFAGCALAQQDYPNRPIRYILPYAPGGSTGFTARLVGQRLTEAWGQQIVIDYRAGANTI